MRLYLQRCGYCRLILFTSSARGVHCAVLRRARSTASCAKALGAAERSYTHHVAVARSGNDDERRFLWRVIQQKAHGRAVHCPAFARRRWLRRVHFVLCGAPAWRLRNQMEFTPIMYLRRGL